MDPAAVADYVVPASGGGREEPFLLARLVCDQLIARPVDTTQPGWESQVADSVFQALDTEIDAAAPPPHREFSQTESAGLARQLLAALTWGFGAGLPETEWIAVAAELSADLRVEELSAADISWVLDQLGRYILVDGEAGQAVYRLAHQSLADYLRPPFESSADDLFDPRAAPVTAALLGLYERQLSAGLAADDPAYLWRYAWRHATLSGLDGLARLKRVAVLTDDLAWDVAMTCEAVSNVLATWGRHGDALTPAVEAVQLYRGLAGDNNPDNLPNLASALNNLGVRLAELGRHNDALPATEEALQLYRGLVIDNPGYLPEAAAALNNLGVALAELGRRSDALTPTEEAVQLRRDLAAENPGYLPDLASALNNLGNRLADLGRHSEALPPAEEAVQLYRGLAAENPGYLPDLASALSNLGNRLTVLGRHSDALAPAEEAVQLRRDLAADNPGYLPNLATALNNLGIGLTGLSRHSDALAPTEEAMQLFRDLAADNPGYLPNLAGALTNLGTILGRLGRYSEARAPAEEAVQLRRALAADNPAHLPNLADALNNLGINLAELGRHNDALAATEEAVQLYRGPAADNAGYLPDLATTLNNFGARLAELGRHGEALVPAEEAVQLRRGLAADNPGYLPDLASALNNLGVTLAELGRRSNALAAAEEAVQLYRGLAADNPAHLPNLAGAMSNLGNRLAGLRRYDEALPPVEEAVQFYRGLAAENPGHLPDLASALNSLGNRLAELGRHGDALVPTEEAVQLRRTLAADNPAAYLPNLAGVLNNLGVRLARLGRRSEALAAAEEAVQLYRGLAADNPGHLAHLAATTGLLGQLRGELQGSETVDAVWQQVLDGLPPDARATLLMYRARQSDDDLAAAGWLAEADSLATGDRWLRLAIHDEARRLRHLAPADFDAAWTTATDSPIPDWAKVSPELVNTVRAWISTASYLDEAAFLAAHLELLPPDADLAVHEGLLELPDDEAARYQRLRAEAQTTGVNAAYRPLVQLELAAEFVRTNPAWQRQLLASRRADLLDELVLETIRGWAAQDESGPAAAASSLLTLAATEPSTFIDEMLDSIDSPDDFTDLLQRTAEAGHAARLAEAAAYGLSAPTSRSGAVSCLFFRAVAAILDQDADTATQYVAAARNADPDARDTWIDLAARIAGHQPEVLKLIPMLTNPLPIGQETP
jgi:tetratricopeptide (TPR) repeat protein